MSKSQKKVTKRYDSPRYNKYEAQRRARFNKEIEKLKLELASEVVTTTKEEVIIAALLFVQRCKRLHETRIQSDSQFYSVEAEFKIQTSSRKGHKKYERNLEDINKSASAPNRILNKTRNRLDSIGAKTIVDQDSKENCEKPYTCARNKHDNVSSNSLLVASNDQHIPNSVKVVHLESEKGDQKCAISDSQVRVLPNALVMKTYAPSGQVCRILAPFIQDSGARVTNLTPLRSENFNILSAVVSQQLLPAYGNTANQSLVSNDKNNLCIISGANKVPVNATIQEINGNVESGSKIGAAVAISKENIVLSNVPLVQQPSAVSVVLPKNNTNFSNSVLLDQIKNGNECESNAISLVISQVPLTNLSKRNSFVIVSPPKLNANKPRPIAPKLPLLDNNDQSARSFSCRPKKRNFALKRKFDYYKVPSSKKVRYNEHESYPASSKDLDTSSATCVSGKMKSPSSDTAENNREIFSSNSENEPANVINFSNVENNTNTVYSSFVDDTNNADGQFTDNSVITSRTTTNEVAVIKSHETENTAVVVSLEEQIYDCVAKSNSESVAHDESEITSVENVTSNHEMRNCNGENNLILTQTTAAISPLGAINLEKQDVGDATNRKFDACAQFSVTSSVPDNASVISITEAPLSESSSVCSLPTNLITSNYNSCTDKMLDQVKTVLTNTAHSADTSNSKSVISNSNNATNYSITALCISSKDISIAKNTHADGLSINHQNCEQSEQDVPILIKSTDDSSVENFGMMDSQKVPQIAHEIVSDKLPPKVDIFQDKDSVGVVLAPNNSELLQTSTNHKNAFTSTETAAQSLNAILNTQAPSNDKDNLCEKTILDAKKKHHANFSSSISSPYTICSLDSSVKVSSCADYAFYSAAYSSSLTYNAVFNQANNNVCSHSSSKNVTSTVNIYTGSVLSTKTASSNSSSSLTSAALSKLCSTLSQAEVSSEKSPLSVDTPCKIEEPSVSLPQVCKQTVINNLLSSSSNSFEEVLSPITICSSMPVALNLSTSVNLMVKSSDAYQQTRDCLKTQNLPHSCTADSITIPSSKISTSELEFINSHLKTITPTAISNAALSLSKSRTFSSKEMSISNLNQSVTVSSVPHCIVSKPFIPMLTTKSISQQTSQSTVFSSPKIANNNDSFDKSSNSGTTYSSTYSGLAVSSLVPNHTDKHNSTCVSSERIESSSEHDRYHFSTAVCSAATTTIVSHSSSAGRSSKKTLESSDCSNLYLSNRVGINNTNDVADDENNSASSLYSAIGMSAKNSFYLPVAAVSSPFLNSNSPAYCFSSTHNFAPTYASFSSFNTNSNPTSFSFSLSGEPSTTLPENSFPCVSASIDSSGCQNQTSSTFYSSENKKFPFPDLVPPVVVTTSYDTYRYSLAHGWDNSFPICSLTVTKPSLQVSLHSSSSYNTLLLNSKDSSPLRNNSMDAMALAGSGFSTLTVSNSSNKESSSPLHGASQSFSQSSSVSTNAAVIKAKNELLSNDAVSQAALSNVPESSIVTSSFLDLSNNSGSVKNSKYICSLANKNSEKTDEVSECQSEQIAAGVQDVDCSLSKGKKSKDGNSCALSISQSITTTSTSSCQLIACGQTSLSSAGFFIPPATAPTKSNCNVLVASSPPVSLHQCNIAVGSSELLDNSKCKTDLLSKSNLRDGIQQSEKSTTVPAALSNNTEKINSCSEPIQNSSAVSDVDLTNTKRVSNSAVQHTITKLVPCYTSPEIAREDVSNIKPVLHNCSGALESISSDKILPADVITTDVSEKQVIFNVPPEKKTIVEESAVACFDQKVITTVNSNSQLTGGHLNKSSLKHSVSILPCSTADSKASHSIPAHQELNITDSRDFLSSSNNSSIPIINTSALSVSNLYPNIQNASTKSKDQVIGEKFAKVPDYCKVKIDEVFQPLLTDMQSGTEFKVSSESINEHLNTHTTISSTVQPLIYSSISSSNVSSPNNSIYMCAVDKSVVDSSNLPDQNITTKITSNFNDDESLLPSFSSSSYMQSYSNTTVQLYTNAFTESQLAEQNIDRNDMMLDASNGHKIIAGAHMPYQSVMEVQHPHVEGQKHPTDVDVQPILSQVSSLKQNQSVPRANLSQSMSNFYAHSIPSTKANPYLGHSVTCKPNPPSHSANMYLQHSQQLQHQQDKSKSIHQSKTHMVKSMETLDVQQHDAQITLMQHQHSHQHPANVHFSNPSGPNILDYSTSMCDVSTNNTTSNRRNLLSPRNGANVTGGDTRQDCYSTSSYSKLAQIPYHPHMESSDATSVGQLNSVSNFLMDESVVEERETLSDHVRCFSVSHLVSHTSPRGAASKASTPKVEDKKQEKQMATGGSSVAKPPTSNKKNETKSRSSKAHLSQDSRKRSPARNNNGAQNNAALWNNSNKYSLNHQKPPNYSAEALISSQNYMRPAPASQLGNNQNYSIMSQNVYQYPHQMKNFAAQNTSAVSFGYTSASNTSSEACVPDYNFSLHQPSGSLGYTSNMSPYMAHPYTYHAHHAHHHQANTSAGMLTSDIMASSSHPPYPRFHEFPTDQNSFSSSNAAGFSLPFDSQDMCISDVGGGAQYSGSSAMVDATLGGAAQRGSSCVPFSPLRMMERQQTTGINMGPSHFSSSLANFNLTSIIPEIDSTNKGVDNVNLSRPPVNSSTAQSRLSSSSSLKLDANRPSLHHQISNTNNLFHTHHQVGFGLNSALPPLPSSTFTGLNFPSGDN